MPKLHLVVSLIAAAVTLAIAAAPADAHYGCRYDPYGYRAPSRDCGHPYRYYWGDNYPDYVVVAPAVPVYPRDRVITVPVYSRFYGPPPGCYYDNGWYNVVLVCY